MSDISGNVQQFRIEATKFTEIDKRIKEITEAIKPLTEELRSLKKEKTSLKKDICDFMGKNNLEQCSLKDTNNMLIYRKRKTLIPITKELIKSELVRFFGSQSKEEQQEFNKLDYEKKAELIFKYIYEDREYKYTEVLQNKNI